MGPVSSLRLLIDTHALIWWALEESRLPHDVRRQITSAAEVIASAASAWEVAIKRKTGRLPVGASHFAENFDDYMRRYGFATLPISVNHATRAGSLPLYHRDPFDRILIAQAQIEQLAIISSDTAFDRYGVQRIW